MTESILENEMKDLIQEGRKIQETFKKNVINEEGFLNKLKTKFLSLNDPRNYSKFGNWGIVEWSENPNDLGKYVCTYVGLRSYISTLNGMTFAKKYNKKIKYIQAPIVTLSRNEITSVTNNDIGYVSVKLYDSSAPSAESDVDFYFSKDYKKMNISDKDERRMDKEYTSQLYKLGEKICSDLQKEIDAMPRGWQSSGRAPRSFEPSPIEKFKSGWKDAIENPLGPGW